VKELRRWQVEVLGADFVKALAAHRKAAPAAPAAASTSSSAASAKDESPYRD
jgi:hypothetical protein